MHCRCWFYCHRLCYIDTTNDIQGKEYFTYFDLSLSYRFTASESSKRHFRNISKETFLQRFMSTIDSIAHNKFIAIAVLLMTLVLISEQFDRASIFNFVVLKILFICNYVAHIQSSNGSNGSNGSNTALISTVIFYMFSFGELTHTTTCTARNTFKCQLCNNLSSVSFFSTVRLSPCTIVCTLIWSTSINWLGFLFYHSVLLSLSWYDTRRCCSHYDMRCHKCARRPMWRNIFVVHLTFMPSFRSNSMI